MYFPPLDGNKSNPSHEFAGDRKMMLPQLNNVCLNDIEKTNRMTYFPCFAINLS